MEKEMNELWDKLLEYGEATEDEISLVMEINGHTLETLESILYARTGYHSLEQWKECELDEWEEEDTIGENDD